MAPSVGLLGHPCVGLPGVSESRNGCRGGLSDCSDSRAAHDMDARAVQKSVIPFRVQGGTVGPMETPRFAGSRIAALRAAGVPRSYRSRAHLARLGASRVAGSLGRDQPNHDALPQSRALVGLAHLHGRRIDAAVRPDHLAAAVDGLVGTPRARYERAAGASARGAGLDVPLRHRLVGEGRALGGRPVRDSSPPRRRCRRRGRSTFVSAEEPYDDTLTLEQARLSDVMLAYEMDGSRSRAPTARRSARDPGDVRLQERQVGGADQARVAAPSPATGSSAATTRMPGSGDSNGL